MTERTVLISPSLLSCDFTEIGRDVAMVEAAGADWLHVDVMDAHFVPNLTIGPPVVKAISKVATVPLDVHLMISDPARYAEAFAKAGAYVLTFHWEVAPSVEEARAVIQAFRDAGVEKVGISVNPDTCQEPLAELFDELDLILVMSVFPGFGGQKFIPEVLDKVRWLRAAGYEGWIEMDGGVNADTIASCAEAGTDVFVAGSAIFGAEDIPGTIEGFRATALERMHVG
jgi:ribulose-phosphate 3-epimerase